jgi:branched-chain amino acid transport system permease protein
MKTFLQYLKLAGTALAIIIFLDLIGFPRNLGRFGVWLMAIVLAALTFFFTRADRQRLKPIGILGKVLIVALIPTCGLVLVTYLIAKLQGNGVNFAPVFAQIVPEHTGTLIGLTKKEILSGVNPIPGLINLAFLFSAAGVIGGLINIIPRFQTTENIGDQRTKAAKSFFLKALPFLLFASYLFLRLPSVELFGSKEKIIGLVLLFLFYSSAMFAFRAIQSGQARVFYVIVIGLFSLWIPFLNDLFQNSVLGIVTIFVVMGIGLNIVVGFAGMLDLGYVAFFAVGAYSYGMLSSPTSWVLVNFPSFHGITFWVGLPIAMLVGVLAGVLLGVPVLRLRGDYLAIVTLGFGEIIRLLLLNMREYTAGPQGVLGVPSPFILGHDMGNPRDILLLAMVVAALVAFFAARLRESRLGRAWVAMREDERVAQAMGINLVATKLLAFAFGATFAAISGTIYAARQINIYPDNFALDVSINVLSLIIIGGIGSIEGIVIGAIALIGLPEILRSVDQYRIIAFGALLVAMMILRPEGFLPSLRRKRELHRVELENAPIPGKQSS